MRKFLAKAAAAPPAGVPTPLERREVLMVLKGEAGLRDAPARQSPIGRTDQLANNAADCPALLSCLRHFFPGFPAPPGPPTASAACLSPKFAEF